ncbi:MAG TPA: hypothetical protein VML55_22705 [Planctomycetaceae bacterium]|nr:hypothetical protein [Planctomycetaceae bacterium]
MRYDHTQRAPFYLILVAPAVGMLAGAWFIPNPTAQIIFLGGAGLVILCAASCRQLTVRDEGDELLIQFGPLPLFRRRSPYAEIERVQSSRSTLRDGWGIHWSRTGGWIWNLWGFDCVDVCLSHGRTLRIGTDDPAGLASFLNEQVIQPQRA